jgi:hypothetical protein
MAGLTAIWMKISVLGNIEAYEDRELGRRRMLNLTSNGPDCRIVQFFETWVNHTTVAFRAQRMDISLETWTFFSFESDIHSIYSANPKTLST